ncbi:SAM-dependent methyltransferase [Brevundimonas sp. NPDC046655]|uniref:SAM-dependent methyltransferase n=1 Tax=unclassified Brevundimonas TaxID=2622653 RepID=UPI00384B6F72
MAKAGRLRQKLQSSLARVAAAIEVPLFNPFSKRSARFRQRLAKAPARLEVLETQVARLAQALEEHRRETRLLYSALALPERSAWEGQPPLLNGQPGQNVFPFSTVCRQDSFETPAFSYWCRRLDEGLRYHRKLWEFVFICQALWERGAIRPGARGLGFGVGSEPLSAYFASEGCRITATDMAVERAEEMGWILTNEHAQGKAALRKPAVCPDDLFDANVEFRTCDMNHVPDDLTGYDFCWSACAFEHLGSIEKGLAFVERSIDCLKPGGWAVHTSEYNYGSNTETIDHQDTVLFRRRDLEDLVARLQAKGHCAAPFDFSMGNGLVEQYIDVMPYRDQPHLRMSLWGHPTTSVGVIIQRGEA